MAHPEKVIIRAGYFPESIQETSVQVNTFSVEHSRAAGLQTIFTTKSGSDSFHGSASDWFNYQGMFANQHFVSSSTNHYQPFHSNNMDFAVGGPIFPHHNSFFFFAVEPLRSSASAGGSVTFADPQFIAFAKNNYPNTVGTHVLTTYLPSGIGSTSVWDCRRRLRHDGWAERRSMRSAYD